MTALYELLIEQMGRPFICTTTNEYIRIQTPYLYPDGDIIDLFYKEQDGIVTLTDLGETLRWPRMQTLSQRKSRRQRQLIDDICLTHNIELYRGMLTVRVRQSEDLVNAVTRLSQGILRVSDLWFTFRNKIGESIVEDVADFLQEKQVAFDPDPKIIGRSALVWQPDFQTRGKQHSSLVRVLSTGSRAVGRNQVFRTTSMWVDLNHFKVGREALQFITLFDDTVDIWSQEDIQLIENVSDIAFWTRPDEFLGKVA